MRTSALLQAPFSWQATTALLLSMAALTAPAGAQVAIDGTTGPGIPLDLDGPDYQITDDLGTRAGDNLFHSFSEFSIDTSESATFSGPDEIENVISRVTGPNPSDIDGTLRSTMPAADFYFINPNGVTFGPNAALDVQGSFHVSTADELQIEGGEVFSATNPDASGFAVAEPRAFGFYDAEIGDITINQSRLSLSPGSDLSIVGGDISINGRLDAPPEETTIGTSNGDIFIFAASSAGTVNTKEQSSDILEKGLLTMTGRSVIELSDSDNNIFVIESSGLILDDRSLILNFGGSIFIVADGIALSNRSAISASSNSQPEGGDIIIRASDIIVKNNSNISSDNLFSFGDGGSVDIESYTLILQDGGVIASATRGAGDGGEVRIKTGMLKILALDVVIDDFSDSNPTTIPLTGITASVQPGATGAAGSVFVEADNIQIMADQGGASIGSSTRNQNDGGAVSVKSGSLTIVANQDPNVPGKGVANIITSALADSTGGNGGDIEIDVGTLTLTSGADIGSVSDVGALGGAGSIKIKADVLTMSEASEITTQTFGSGNAGRLIIEANSILMQNDAFIASTAEPGSFGEGGDVNIDAVDITLINGSEISTSTISFNDAGSVEINARDINILGGESRFATGISSRSLGLFGGNSGEITITGADNVSISDGGKITSSTAALVFGGAGAIKIETGNVTLSGSGSEITSSTGEASFGSAGTIEIDADTIELSDNAQIATLSNGFATAGSVVLNLENRLSLNDNARITAETAFADAGGIIVTDGKIVDVQNSEISTSVANGQGGGGNISIASDFVLLSNAEVIANAREGDGGNIEVDAESYLGRSSIVSASSDLGIDGTVVINSPEVDLTGGLLVLDSQFVDASRLLRESCESGGDLGGSTFVTSGQSPTLAPSDGLLPGFYSDAPVTAKERTAATGAASRPCL